MITLHLEAESPSALIHDVKQMFNLVEKVEAVPVITTDDLKAALATDCDEGQPAPVPAKRGRKPKVTDGPSTAEVKAATIGEAPTEPAASPGFLGGDEETKPEAEKEMSIEDMRAAAQKLAEAKGMEAVAKVLGTFKSEKGEPALKMSLVQPSDRAKAAAAFEAAASAKE